MKILVTGGSGVLGQSMLACARARHRVWGTYHSHPAAVAGAKMLRLDVTDQEQVFRQLSALRPDVVIHAAALTDVDECERHPEEALRINSEGTAITAQAAEELGCRYVYISTDYVFDGQAGGYRESDAPSPVNQYGISKHLGEQQARRSCSRALTIRTTFFGPKMPPLVGMMEGLIAALRQGRPVKRFVDQFFTPLYSRTLSEIVLALVEREVCGLYHVGSRDRVSRCEFARLLAESFGLNGSTLRPVPFEPIEGLARRPRDTSLDCELVVRSFGVALPSVKDDLNRCKSEWAAAAAREGTGTL